MDSANYTSQLSALTSEENTANLALNQAYLSESALEPDSEDRSKIQAKILGARNKLESIRAEKSSVNRDMTIAERLEAEEVAEKEQEENLKLVKQEEQENAKKSSEKDDIKFLDDTAVADDAVSFSSQKVMPQGNGLSPFASEEDEEKSAIKATTGSAGAET